MHTQRAGIKALVARDADLYEPTYVLVDGASRRSIVRPERWWYSARQPQLRKSTLVVRDVKQIDCAVPR